MKSRRFHSAATSPGIAIGCAIRTLHRNDSFLRAWVREQDADEEVARFKIAVQRSKEQLSGLQAKMCRLQGHDQINIIESYRMFLQDDMLIAATQKRIQENMINAEWALDQTLAQLKLSFLNVNEEYLKERVQDINYIGRRLMNNLTGNPQPSFTKLPPGEHILIAHDLSPADIAILPKDRVRGFAMEMGGETSHSAIIARALEVPAIFGAHNILEEIKDGETVILDGMKGLLIASPNKKELEQYRSIQQKYAALEMILMEDIHLPAETKDGLRIKIEANMELIEEIPSLLQHGAEGIGLYRTEYLFLNRLDEPSEEEQYENYVEILERLNPRPVTIRTIDLGADKLPLSRNYEAQNNPALGLRAIRICLKEIPLFKTQLRALLRASMSGNLKILIPMIASLDELRQTHKILREVKRELTNKGIPFKKNIPVGIMIEVPAAAFIAPELAREADFFSIGTNDLIQYGLAIDRVNENVAELYNPYHPGILRIVRQTVQAAKDAGIPISVCGEMAGDPLAITLMIGMEVDSLSMNSISISRIKKILRSVTKEQSEKLLKEALTLSTAGEVENLLRTETSHLLPGEVRKLHIIG